MRSGPKRKPLAEYRVGRPLVINQLLELIEPYADNSIGLAAGVTQTWISEIRRGINRNPSIRNVQAVANVLGYELVLQPINKEPPHDKT